ncbi:hypothetical protein Vretimale_10388, partial [Volvox reticuliferus]
MLHLQTAAQSTALAVLAAGLRALRDRQGSVLSTLQAVGGDSGNSAQSNEATQRFTAGQNISSLREELALVLRVTLLVLHTVHVPRASAVLKVLKIEVPRLLAILSTHGHRLASSNARALGSHTGAKDGALHEGGHCDRADEG